MMLYLAEFKHSNAEPNPLVPRSSESSGNNTLSNWIPEVTLIRIESLFLMSCTETPSKDISTKNARIDPSK